MGFKVTASDSPALQAMAAKAFKEQYPNEQVKVVRATRYSLHVPVINYKYNTTDVSLFEMVVRDLKARYPNTRIYMFEVPA
jgi:hypothetical protein